MVWYDKSFSDFCEDNLPCSSIFVFLGMHYIKTRVRPDIRNWHSAGYTYYPAMHAGFSDKAYHYQKMHCLKTRVGPDIRFWHWQGMTDYPERHDGYPASSDSCRIFWSGRQNTRFLSRILNDWFPNISQLNNFFSDSAYEIGCCGP